MGKPDYVFTKGVGVGKERMGREGEEIKGWGGG